VLEEEAHAALLGVLAALALRVLLLLLLLLLLRKRRQRFEATHCAEATDLLMPPGPFIQKMRSLDNATLLDVGKDALAPARD
jgi:predicted tellurium resistance membrane protein TerC